MTPKSLDRFTLARLLAVLKPTMKKLLIVNYHFDNKKKNLYSNCLLRELSILPLALKGTEFSPLHSELKKKLNNKQSKKNLEFEQLAAMTIKLLLVKKRNSKRNCSHVNGIQLQNPANVLPASSTNVFLPALQG